MTKLSRRQIAAFARFSDDELRLQFDRIGDRAESHVKSGKNKGMIKIKSARFGDEILAEINRRNSK